MSGFITVHRARSGEPFMVNTNQILTVKDGRATTDQEAMFHKQGPPCGVIVFTTRRWGSHDYVCCRESRAEIAALLEA